MYTHWYFIFQTKVSVRSKRVSDIYRKLILFVLLLVHSSDGTIIADDRLSVVELLAMLLIDVENQTRLSPTSLISIYSGFFCPFQYLRFRKRMCKKVICGQVQMPMTLPMTKIKSKPIKKVIYVPELLR